MAVLEDDMLIGAFFQVGSRKDSRASRTDKEMEQMAAEITSDIAALATSDGDRYNYAMVEYRKLIGIGDWIKGLVEHYPLDPVEYETARDDPARRKDGGDPGNNFSVLTQAQVWMCFSSEVASDVARDRSMRIMALAYNFFRQVLAKDVDRIRLERAVAYRDKLIGSGETAQGARWEKVIASLEAT